MTFAKTLYLYQTVKMINLSLKGAQKPSGLRHSLREKINEKPQDPRVGPPAWAIFEQLIVFINLCQETETR